MRFLAGDTDTISVQLQQFKAVDGIFTVPDNFEKHMLAANFQRAPNIEASVKVVAPVAAPPMKPAAATEF